MLLCLSVLLLVNVLGADSNIEGNVPADPDLKAIEHQFLIFPLTHKDFENWQSLGSAVFLRNKAVLTPEANFRKGIIHTTKPISKDFTQAWVAYMDFSIGNAAGSKVGTGGLGLYYLRNIDEENKMSSQFGFSDKFDGAAVIINTSMRSKDKTTGEFKSAI